VDSQKEEFDPAAELDENGIDLRRLRRNRAMSPEERYERNFQAAQRILDFHHAGAATRLQKPNTRP
jgi:hypothetical protein